MCSPEIQDDFGAVCICEVAVNRPVHQTYSYLVPELYVSELALGSRVEIPFGRSSSTGVVVSVSRADTLEELGIDYRLKEILSVCDVLPPLTAEHIELARWISQAYLCSLGEALGAMAPPQFSNRGDALLSLTKSEGFALRRLRANAARQISVINILKDGPLKRSEVIKLGKWASPVINGLVKKGLVREVNPLAEINLSFDGGQDDIARYHKMAVEQIDDSLFQSLTDCQSRAVSQIGELGTSCDKPVTLLHGITGSGKTEIYLNLIRSAVEAGGSAVVLVPEIALTVPMISVFKKRFGEGLAVLHSRLTGVERYREWMRIRTGQARVVMGARSAIFAPVHNPLLFILDEEGENSFKQQDVPRYHAREVAIHRAQMGNARVVLGSATPCLESYYKAISGEYTYIRLEKRISGRPLSPISFVDMSREFTEKRNRSVFSTSLKKALNDTFVDDGQAMLFLNRRGHSTYVFCRSCSYVCKCPECDSNYIYHFTTGRLRCHRCDTTIKAPVLCPQCSSKAIRFCGTGTQKVEEEFQANYPNIPLSRMDSDTTTTRGSHQEIYEEFASGKTRCLVGTQMIARGFDFHNLHVAAIMNIDSTLNMPDFRAAERTFSLLVQVAGRVGRGQNPALVIAQSYSPKMSVYEHAKTHDYDGFAKEELELRKALNYPPFSRIVLFLCESKKDEQASELLYGLFCELSKAFNSLIEDGTIQVLGPYPAVISKVKGVYRWQLMVKVASQDDAQIISQIGELFTAAKVPSGCRLKVNVDPLNAV